MGIHNLQTILQAIVCINLVKVNTLDLAMGKKKKKSTHKNWDYCSAPILI